MPGWDWKGWMILTVRIVRMTVKMTPLMHLTEVVHQAADAMKMLETRMNVQAALWIR